MADVSQLNDFISVKEYLDGEIEAEVRHEYLGGRVYAMAGGTRNHNRICINLSGLLNTSLSAPCSVFSSDLKLKVETLASISFYYPDVMIGCDPSDNNEQYLESPTTIFEVLSDSTERIDRTEKFFAYRTLDSLEEYVIVSQKTREITVARKSNDWKAEIYSGDDFALALSCLSSPITSDQIYSNVNFV